MERTGCNGISFAILGIGATGFSVAKFLERQNTPFVFADTRSVPPLLQEAKKAYPKVPYFLANFDEFFFDSIEIIAVSPGIPLNTPVLEMAKAKGIKLIGTKKSFVPSLLGVKIFMFSMKLIKVLTLKQMKIDKILSLVILKNRYFLLKMILLHNKSEIIDLNGLYLIWP